MSSIGFASQAGRNQKDLRLINWAVVFRMIREAGEISRSELAQRTGLNPATVTHITREMLGQGLIEEAGLGESSGGRPRALLRLRSEQGYIIAVRLSRHNIQGMLTDLDMRTVTRHEITSSSLSHPLEVTLPNLLDLIQTLIDKSGVARETIYGIGICAPGPLDARQGMLISPPNFPGWPSMPIRQIVEERTGFPVFLDNDANAAALAEKWFGVAREMESFAYILVEDGVGGGIFVGGDIYRGEHDVAGEVGHMSVNFNGPVCDCGNIGCLELYAAPGVVENHACRAITEGKASHLLGMVNGQLDRISFELIAQAAAEGDEVAFQAVTSIIDPLAVGMTNVVNAFDPEAIIFGGKIGLAAGLIQGPLQEKVARRALARGSRQVPILFGGLGAESPIIGAFALILRELFQNPEFHFSHSRGTVEGRQG